MPGEVVLCHVLPMATLANNERLFSEPPAGEKVGVEDGSIVGGNRAYCVMYGQCDQQRSCLAWGGVNTCAETKPRFCGCCHLAGPAGVGVECSLWVVSAWGWPSGTPSHQSQA